MTRNVRNNISVEQCRVFNNEKDFCEHIVNNGSGFKFAKQYRFADNHRICPDVERVSDGKSFEVEYSFDFAGMRISDNGTTFNARFGIGRVLNGLYQALYYKKRLGSAGLILPYECQEHPSFKKIALIADECGIEIVFM